MNTDIRIDTISFKGLNLAPHRAEQVRQETASQLQQLIAQRGLPAGAGAVVHVPSVTLPPHAIGPGASDREIARAMARAVYDAIGR